MPGSAIISRCGKYRYRLERHIGRGKTAAIIMVNPSIADAEIDDHSIRKCFGFATKLGIGKIIVGNKFAYRATNIKELRTCPDPVGPDNDMHLRSIMEDADLHIVAWGRLSKLPAPLRHRWITVVRIAEDVDCPLFCLGTVQGGHPRHPLMTGYDTALTAWDGPVIA